MLKTLRALGSFTFVLGCLAVPGPVSAGAQAAEAAAQPSKPTEHVLGTVTGIDKAAQTITVKDDKTGTESVISLAGTRTLLKVEPGAKDLHTATRITAEDLAAGDRVDVRGFKSDTANEINAKSVVLMSARDLAQKHEAELQAWQHSTVGNVASLNDADHTFIMQVNTGGERKPVVVQTSGATEYSRYSTDSPKTATGSKFGDIQAGDQVHIIGQLSADGSSLTAQKIYSAPVRTVAATVISISPESKQIVAKNLQTKQPTTIVLTDASSVRKLPPQMAMFLARRFNPSAAPGGAPGTPNAASGGGPGGTGAGAGSYGAGSGGGRPGGPNAGAGPNAREGGAAGGAHGPRDLSHMLDQIPPIGLTDLKPGDAIVVWGYAGHDAGSVVANTVLAGVEPVLQSAPLRQGQSLDSDWGLNVAVPAQ